MRPHISVCICTFRRPALLRRLLLELEQQATGGHFSYSVIVVDNDSQQAARPVFEEILTRGRLNITYTSEARQNIALARNAALKLSTGDYIAFIDDDEFPIRTWLFEMWSTCERLAVAGVLGPVRPHFEERPPAWIVKGRFCERPEYSTGRTMVGADCRTGNVLFRTDLVIPSGTPAFREEFATGGEDVDFFVRMTIAGHVFQWCNEGIVYENVPAERWTRSYMLKRALLRGRNTLKVPGCRYRRLVTSVVAVPTYAAIMPIALLLGQHVFMRYCIKFCDHAGRLLAAMGINPILSRT